MLFERSPTNGGQRQLLYFNRTNRPSAASPHSTRPYRITRGRSILRSFTPDLAEPDLLLQVIQWVNRHEITIHRPADNDPRPPFTVEPFGVVFNQTESNGVRGPAYLLLVFAVHLAPASESRSADTEETLQQHPNGCAMMADDGGRWASVAQLQRWAEEWGMPFGDRMVLKACQGTGEQHGEYRFFVPC